MKQAGAEMCQAHFKLWFGLVWFGFAWVGWAWLGMAWHGLVYV